MPWTWLSSTQRQSSSMIVDSHPAALREKGAWTFCIATVGNFDGVHLGHQALLRHTVDKAREQHVPAVAVTFDPHPVSVLSSCAPKELCSTAQRLEYMEQLGIDAVLLLPFTRALASESAGAFCRRVLQEGLAVRELFIGYDFRMGRDQAGIDVLRPLLPSVSQVDAVLMEGLPVSSTRIRKALAEGRLDEANMLLGRPFSVQGEVVHGEGRGGPLLGIPTANLDVPHTQAMTAPAVYATSARLLDGAGAGEWHMSVTSFCKNPTFDGAALTLETHIMDFSCDIYGRELEVRFLARLRQDRRFDGLEALIAQLHADMAERRRLPL